MVVGGEAPAAGRAAVLGPPGETVPLGPVLEGLDLPPGPLAAVTVGWREEESATAPLEREAERLGRELTPLGLGERARRVFDRDPELAEAHRKLQDGLRAEESLYRERMKQEIAMTHALARIAVPEERRRPYLEAAWQGILEADRFHLAGQAAQRAEFRAALSPEERPSVRAETGELAALLAGCAAALVAGGHVAVIRNRLSLFGLAPRLARLPLVAWSAGAMALSPKVVLFHDRLPFGSRQPEVHGEGAGVLPGAVFFPDARHRLDTEDPEHLAELARRVAPDRGVLLDAGESLTLADGTWSSPEGIRLLSPEGEVETVGSFAARPGDFTGAAAGAGGAA